jgi:predicted alpha/beta superfamily hydrolase
MQMRSFLLLTAVLAFGSMAGTAQPSGVIVIGKTDTIHSRILNEDRPVLIHVPDDYKAYPTQRYPVVYLLDGDAHFPSVMGMIQQLTEVNGNTVFPDMILVGIPNTNRQRDLTPTRAKASPYGDSNSVRGTGGGENFTAFIEKELMPHIDSVYPAAPYRIMIGHSLGGLMVINTLVNHPNLFSSYIAIDPSMWWDDRKLLVRTESVLARQEFTGKTLFLAIANTMPAGMDTAKVRKDTSNTTLHIRSILRLSDDLKRNKGNGLRFDYKYYAHDTHGSVPLIAEYDGFRFMFDFFIPPYNQLLFDDKSTAEALTGAVRSHYSRVSRKMGYTVLPPEPLINSLGYMYLQMGKWDRSAAFFRMNAENYPESGNTYDSLGDLYSEAGDHRKAVEAYAKALSLNDNPDTRKKLEEQKAKIR